VVVPGVFIAFIVLTVLAVLVSLVVFAASPAVASPWRVKCAALVSVWLVPLVVLGWASSTIVSPRNVGVTTQFGKPTGALSNGFHWKSPLARVREMDGAIQTDSITVKDSSGARVRLGNNSMAVVENSVQWRIRQAAATKLYLDYRSFEKTRDHLVLKQFQSALNDVLAEYNPLAGLRDGLNASQNDDLARRVSEVLRDRIGGQIEVVRVLLPLIRFDEDTQNKVNAFNSEVANTRIAEQRKLTAEKEAEANRVLSASVSNDPNVLVSKCLDIVKARGGSPAGCWPGTGVIAGIK